MIKKLKYLAFLALMIPLSSLQAHNEWQQYDEDEDFDDVCIFVTHIKFDHKAGETTEGMNIRKSFAADLDHAGDGAGQGEYKRDTRSEEALYQVDKTVTCMVKIQTTGWDPVTGKHFQDKTFKIRAEGQGDLNVDLNQRTVTIAKNSSGYVEFTFSKKTHLWDNAEEDISKVVGNFKWFVAKSDGSDEREMNKPLTGEHTFYCVLAKPTAPWYNGQADDKDHPWVSALEFAIVEANTEGIKTLPKAAEQITDYCLTDHGLTYETVSGDIQYIDADPATGGVFRFDATSYIVRADEEANCHDQALAVDTFAGILGVPVTWYRIDTLGYSELDTIVGGYLMNNPFSAGTHSNGKPYSTRPDVFVDSLRDVDLYDINNAPIVGGDGSMDRSYFGNHGIADHSGKVYDACVGPHLGTETHAQYMTAAQDTSTAPEDLVDGGAGDFANYAAKFTSIK